MTITRVLSSCLAAYRRRCQAAYRRHCQAASRRRCRARCRQRAAYRLRCQAAYRRRCQAAYRRRCQAAFRRRCRAHCRQRAAYRLRCPRTRRRRSPRFWASCTRPVLLVSERTISAPLIHNWIHLIAPRTALSHPSGDESCSDTYAPYVAITYGNCVATLYVTARDASDGSDCQGACGSAFVLSVLYSRMNFDAPCP